MKRPAVPTMVKLAVTAVPILAIAWGLIYLAPFMRPVKQGTSAGFWYAAWGVKLASFNPQRDESFAIHTPRDGFFTYYDEGFHGSFFYAVKEADALADFPEVVRRLDSELVEKGPISDNLRVYKKWRAAGGSRSNALTLLEQEHEVVRERMGRRLYAGGRYWLEEQKGFEQSWPKFQRYPVNVALEFLYLSGLVVFGFWPWLRRLKPWRWALHIGLIPILVCLPYFLGYCPVFLKLNPFAGTLYPWIAMWFTSLGSISLPFDTVVLFSLPKPLAGLSAAYYPGTVWGIYYDFWADFGYGLSASSVIALGTGLAMVTYVVAWPAAGRRRRKTESVAAILDRTSSETETAQAASAAPDTGVRGSSVSRA